MVMKHRIAFCGSAGTGKTTLAKLVETRLKIPMNPKGSREAAAAMGFASPYDVDAAGRRGDFQRLLLEMKYGWEHLHDEFVTDRTYVDNMVYTLLHDIDSVDPAFMDGVWRGNERFTHIFFCPMGAFFELANDPQRKHDIEYHRRFEMLLLARLPDFVSERCSVTLVTASGLDARLSQVMRALGT